MRAIEADAHSPNFAGLSNFMLHAHLASGVPYTPAWDKAISERNRLDAQQLKNLSIVKDADKPAKTAKAKAKAAAKGDG